MGRVLVIGGANVDVGARSSAPLVARDSNPGVAEVSPGGVGRNIARNLQALGAEASLLTVWGEDDFALRLQADAKGAGVDVSLSAAIPGGRTGTYIYLLDDTGDLALAVNDMAVCETITPEFLAPRLNAINRFDLVVLDANLPAGSIAWLCERCVPPVVADPVSEHKCGRLRDVLGGLYAVKPNRMEAEALSGVQITDEASLRRAADMLLRTGLQQVYISLGSRGIYAADRAGHTARYGCPRVEVADATGGGDAMTAAIAMGILEGRSLAETAGDAICAGAFACTAHGAVHPDMSRTSINAIRNREVFK